MEKFDSSPYSEHSFASKMAAYIGGLPFAIKRTILIGCTVGHFRGAFCLLSEVGDTSEAPPRHTLDANWAKKHRRSHLEVDSVQKLPPVSTSV